MPNQTFQVIIKKIGKDPTQWIREVSGRIQFEMQDKLVELGEEAAETMKEVINSSRKNPDRGTHLLENNIKSEILSSTPARVEIGIGRIADLPLYWDLINSGGTYITKKTHIVPTDYFTDRGSGFITFKEGSSHTIQPVRYVEISEEQLRAHIEREVIRLMGEIK